MQMKEADLTRWGKLLALVLRHKPQELGLTVDAHGWAQVRWCRRLVKSACLIKNCWSRLCRQ